MRLEETTRTVAPEPIGDSPSCRAGSTSRQPPPVFTSSVADAGGWKTRAAAVSPTVAVASAPTTTSLTDPSCCWRESKSLTVRILPLSL